MIRTLLKELSPANFSFIMATGILSIVFYKNSWENLALLFLVIGAFAYAGLVGLFTMRFFALGREILQDFKDIQKMFKYLTFSAGTNSLSVGFCLLDYDRTGLVLGLLGSFSTIVLTYVLFCTLFFHIQAPIRIISPFWLLLAIACNSSGIVITTLWEKGILTNQAFLLLAFSFWTFGVFIYMILMTLNIYRMLFFPFVGEDMDPCYWTCMGAAAIAAVDGSRLILLHDAPLFIESITPFIKGMILFLWCWGTAWIPILCLMELWKNAYFKVRFHYQPSLWAMVFPFGMYTDATLLLSSSVDLYIVEELETIWLWITFSMWCVVAYMSRFNPFSKASSISL